MQRNSWTDRIKQSGTGGAVWYICAWRHQACARF